MTPDGAGPGRQRRRSGARPDDPQDGHGVAAAQVRQRDGGRGVAGHDDGLDIPRRELVETLRAEANDLVVRTRAIRRARVVTQIEGVLARQATRDLHEDGQPADPRVEETDGSGIAHPVR